MIRLIVAVDEKLGMAKHGVQPWKLPGDEKYFLDQTKLYGGNVLMGRTTYEVIGHPLRDRTNYIVSHEYNEVPGATWITDLQAFLDNFSDDLWIIGGANIFAQTIGRANELYVTEINQDFDCDQFFPEFKDKFQLKSQSDLQEESDTTYRYCVYVPKQV